MPETLAQPITSFPLSSRTFPTHYVTASSSRLRYQKFLVVRSGYVSEEVLVVFVGSIDNNIKSLDLRLLPP